MHMLAASQELGVVGRLRFLSVLGLGRDLGRSFGRILDSGRAPRVWSGLGMDSSSTVVQQRIRGVSGPEEECVSKRRFGGY